MRVQRVAHYVMNFAALAANNVAASTGQDSFQVDSGYDFWWMKAEAFVFDANGLGVSTLQWPRLTVLLSDGVSQQQLSDEAVAVQSIFGTGQIPYILPQPHKVEATATMNATVTNFHTVTAYSVQLVFSGLHVQKGVNPFAKPQSRVAR